MNQNESQTVPARPVDLTAAQEALIKKITAADVAHLQQMEQEGTRRPCILRDYVAGEAAPSEDRGAVKTFVTFHGVGVLARTFLTMTRIIGHSLDTYLDTSLPGVQEIVVESKDCFDPHEHARFVQATVNQNSIARPDGPLPFGRPPKKH